LKVITVCNEYIYFAMNILSTHILYKSKPNFNFTHMVSQVRDNF
uniref:Uncharacterized protein n=1 Tax=Amphimedon queenslandica TaxID=400682 RepID=A0A1X7TR15_AMPQE